MTEKRINWFLIFAVAGLAIATRLVPHLPNLSVVSALGIFAATFLSVRSSVILTLGVRFVSDLFLGFFSWPLMLAVYFAHAAGPILGKFMLARKGKNAGLLEVSAAGLLSALLFFLVTNFAFFYPFYEHNWSGIVQSYVQGLPFLRGTLLGDIGWLCLLVLSRSLALEFVKRKQQQASQFRLA